MPTEFVYETRALGHFTRPAPGGTFTIPQLVEAARPFPPGTIALRLSNPSTEPPLSMVLWRFKEDTPHG